MRIFSFNFYLFYFWLCWVFTAERGLSLVVASGGYLHCGSRASHLIQWPVLWLLGSRTQAQQLWYMGLVA